MYGCKNPIELIFCSYNMGMQNTCITSIINVWCFLEQVLVPKFGTRKNRMRSRQHLNRMLLLLHRKITLPKQQGNLMEGTQETAELKIQLRYILMIIVFRSIQENG